jgi:hypothetical protein
MATFSLLAIGFAANWWAGWILLLAGFISGAVIGVSFHREDFWGGYGSFRRRIVRLGHIALCALGMLNLLFAFVARPELLTTSIASVCFIVGGCAMPLVCFLSACREGFRRLFPSPVIALVLAVVFTLFGGPS